MGRKLKLLPHWCQIIGYTYIIGFLSCIALASTGMADIFPKDCITTHWNLIGALNFIMIFLAIFSKEKVEDEMTTAIRLNALLYLVFFLFAIHLLLYIPDGWALKKFISGIRDLFMGDFGMMILTYAILFKIMIWINMWRVRNEE